MGKTSKFLLIFILLVITVIVVFMPKLQTYIATEPFILAMSSVYTTSGMIISIILIFITSDILKVKKSESKKNQFLNEKEDRVTSLQLLIFSIDNTQQIEKTDISNIKSEMFFILEHDGLIEKRFIKRAKKVISTIDKGISKKEDITKVSNCLHEIIHAYNTKEFEV